MNQNRSRTPEEGGGSSILRDWDRQFRRAVEAYFRRRGVGQSDSEDLAQDVAMRLARQADLSGVRDVERYLFRTAANVLIDWHRRRAVRFEGRETGEPVEIADPAAGAERLLIARDTIAQLHMVLDALPERTARIFRWYHFDGLRYAQIAAELGIAIRTVEDHMARANAALLAAVDYP